MEKESKRILQERKMRVTPARIAVLRAFSGICTPLSSQDIQKKVKSSAINLVTIYRTVSSLEKAGILKRIDLHADAVHYELADHHHHHIICTTCGKIESFDTCTLEPVSKNIAKKSKKFATIKDHSFELFGVCKVCAKK